MWFDARAKLVEIAGQPPATFATPAPAASPVSRKSRPPAPQTLAPRVAEVARVATPPAQKPEPEADPGRLPARLRGWWPTANLDRPHCLAGRLAGAFRMGTPRAERAAPLRLLAVLMRRPGNRFSIAIGVAGRHTEPCAPGGLQYILGRHLLFKAV